MTAQTAGTVADPATGETFTLAETCTGCGTTDPRWIYPVTGSLLRRRSACCAQRVQLTGRNPDTGRTVRLAVNGELTVYERPFLDDGGRWMVQLTDWSPAGAELDRLTTYFVPVYVQRRLAG